MHKRRQLCLLLGIMMILVLTGCSSSSSPPREDKGPYYPPDMLLSEFREAPAVDVDDVVVDLSGVDEGYIGISAVSNTKLRFQVFHGEDTYTYIVASDGTPSIFPLSGGSGYYSFRLLENITDNKYMEVYSDDCYADMDDEFQPFLRPSDYVPYSPESECVKKAQEFTLTCGDAMGFIGCVYDYITSSVRYDTKKASTVTSGYMPDPDETMRTGKGICFDYAALAAAMLRSQGIPTKMVFGYVSPDDVYHAWNMFYTPETGWVTVKFEADPGWNRMDLTFSAGGVSESFVGDGENYADLYYY